MKLLLTAFAAVFATSTLLGQQTGSAPPPSPAPAAPGAVAEAYPPPTPTPSLVDNLIKLWKANLSEDFLKRYISGSDIAKDLSAEDIVKLRNAGLPESLISAVSDRKLVVVMPSPVPATSPVTIPAPIPTPASSMRWEGLARRNGGVVMLKSRWDPGVLEFKDEALRWTDARDASKNVLLTGEADDGAAAHVPQEARRQRVLRVGREDEGAGVPVPRYRLGTGRERESRGAVRVFQGPLSQPRLVAGSRGREISAGYLAGRGRRISSQSKAAESVRSSVAPLTRSFGDSAYAKTNLSSFWPLFQSARGTAIA